VPEGPTFAVVGATGLVGREALAILAERGVPGRCVRAIASERSAGGRLPFGGGSLTIESIQDASFEGVGAALFCATSEVAREHAPRAIGAGAVVVDNSSAFRMVPAVPLVVPEINGELLDARPTLIANPNCSTIILLTTLEPLRRCFGVSSVSLATYQAISGAGQGGLDELDRQTQALARGESPVPAFFAEPCAGNVFSHDSAVEPETGINGEERKIIQESRKIWGSPSLRVSPTCVRVPVRRAHTQAITVELGRAATEAEVVSALAEGAGLRIVDDRAGNAFPTPAKATGCDEILVGRIRPDPGEEIGLAGRARRWCLLVSADQLRKGAALNAIQIAERVMSPACERVRRVAEVR